MTNPGNIIFLKSNPEVSKGPMSPDEQRASQRFVYESALKIENCDSGTYTYGRMYNYSAGGIYFESDVAFQPGSRVRIEIEKPTAGLDADHLIQEICGIV